MPIFSGIDGSMHARVRPVQGLGERMTASMLDAATANEYFDVLELGLHTCEGAASYLSLGLLQLSALPVAGPLRRLAVQRAPAQASWTAFGARCPSRQTMSIRQTTMMTHTTVQMLNSLGHRAMSDWQQH